MRKTVVIVLLIVSLTASMAYGAFAKQTSGSRPGNGYGDNNHTHSGPPGSTVTRPGNSTADKNHTHTGAPGQK